ncbi:ATP-binding protein [Nocardioides pocheonensis]|uniref:histidine kinase n=1 Tax=Nocardioides pocheonensis TaxID=661485 RepID=A0A3N0GNM6_9ACTN|nr:ATP-binding protein [Nocardioides pocheonensis]RNM14019.1 response regulator [Nocardioides pocheonensis]
MADEPRRTDPDADLEAARVEEGGPAARRTPSSRLPAIAIALATFAAGGALGLVARNVLDRQEHTLLKERTNEVSTILSTAINDARTNLRGAGAAGAADGASPLFTTLTNLSVVQGSQVVVARDQNGSFLTVAAAGTGVPALGAPLPTDLAEVAQRALGAKDMISGIVGSGSNRRVVLALTTPNDPQAVAYISSKLPGRTAAPTTASSPYRELNVALYTGAQASSGALVLASGDVPRAGGGTVTRLLDVGAEKWLLAVSTRDPLVGPLATAFPWLVLGTGAALAVVLGLLTEVLIRRRAYALRLVDERTRSLQEARIAAEKANRAKSEFLSRMSHELRTPLNAVLGFGQLLEMDGLTPDQAENVSQITKGGAHLLDLINEILDISQIESGHMSLSPEAVLVGDVVGAAVSLLRPLAEERGVHLIGGVDHGCGHFIFADRQRLKQILLNLIGNGIKYNRQGGSVSISCFQPVRGTLRIQVTDTGPGIAADQFHLLFAPFERLGAEQTSVPGTGVGLALSRGLAEAMGGKLDVESTPGRGSTFWAEFPIVESPTKIYEEATQRAARPDEGGPLTVLHIEDNLANVELVERVLAQRPDVTVVPAMQGRMGVDLAKRHHPVLILLDLNLVDLPGAEVLQILRDDPVTADIPVAIVSADAMPRQVQRLLSSGAIAYLTKPIDIHRLLEIVDDAVAQATRPGDSVAAQGPLTVVDPDAAG